MKKIIPVLLIITVLATSTSYAQFRYRGGHFGYHGGYGYFGPRFYGGFGIYVNPFAYSYPYYAYPYYAYPYYSPYYAYPPVVQAPPPPPSQQQDGSEYRSHNYNDGNNSAPDTTNRQRDNYPPRQEGPLRVWVAPHWKHTGDGWTWIEGYWKTEQQ